MKGVIIMVLFTILLTILITLAVVAMIGFVLFGAGTILVFGDVIVCAAIIAGILYLIIKKKNKKDK
jgi:hypothetical protein